MYKELVEYIITKLVKNEDVVEVTQESLETNATDKNAYKIKVKVAKEDMGRVIGKEGRIIRSIRELVQSYGMKNSEKISVDIEEIKG